MAPRRVRSSATCTHAKRTQRPSQVPRSYRFHAAGGNVRGVPARPARCSRRHAMADAAAAESPVPRGIWSTGRVARRLRRPSPVHRRPSHRGGKRRRDGLSLPVVTASTPTGPRDAAQRRSPATAPSRDRAATARWLSLARRHQARSRAEERRTRTQVRSRTPRGWRHSRRTPPLEVLAVVPPLTCWKYRSSHLSYCYYCWSTEFHTLGAAMCP